jgi:hypothetical protein
VKKRGAPESEEAVIAIALEHPAGGPLRAANELAQRGVSISAAGVRCVGEHHGLEHITKRRKALEAKVAQDGHIPTEAQLVALEKAKAEKEAQGACVSEWPG